MCKGSLTSPSLLSALSVCVCVCVCVCVLVSIRAKSEGINNGHYNYQDSSQHIHLVDSGS